MKPSILLVEDHETVRLAIEAYLTDCGCDVVASETWRGAEAVLRNQNVDAAVVDYLLPDGNALEWMPRLRGVAPGLPLILLTGHGTIDLAVRAMKEGAEHFLTKPVELAALWLVLERTLEVARVRRRDQAKRAVTARDTVHPFLGTSTAIRQLEAQVRLVAGSSAPVLIHGETGSGKGVLARWLHGNGPRACEPFVDLNCAGLTREFVESELFGHEKGAFTGALSAKPGLLETAHRGTAFLDEVGDLELSVQPRLLKALEEKQFRRMGDVKNRVVDIRLVAASHHDLQALVAARRFREDLYFRISTVPLFVPSLRDRLEDIPLLAADVLRRIGARADLAPGAVAALQKHAWPGNVRELRNVLERAVLLSRGETVTAKHLHFDRTRGDADSGISDLTLEEVERLHVERALERERGRVEKAAARLGIARSSLYHRIRKFGIDLSRF